MSGQEREKGFDDLRRRRLSRRAGRVALSVARLRVSQGRRHEARAPLASVYDRFTEGFATADLQAARTLLDGLPT
jgi:predicted ATPase